MDENYYECINGESQSSDPREDVIDKQVNAFLRRVATERRNFVQDMNNLGAEMRGVLKIPSRFINYCDRHLKSSSSGSVNVRLWRLFNGK